MTLQAKKHYAGEQYLTQSAAHPKGGYLPPTLPVSRVLGYGLLQTQPTGLPRPPLIDYINQMSQRYVAIVLLTVAALCSIGYAEMVPVQRGAFTYYFDHPQYITLADSTLQQTRTRLQNLLDNDLDFSSEIFLAGDQAAFDSLIGGLFPDWGAAAAIPVRQRIVIKSPDRFPLSRPLSELLSHEYSHLALAHRTGLHEAPRWFDEGLAMVVSMEWAWSDNLIMNLAVVFGQFIPLDEIEQVNRFSESRAHLAYSESYLAVQYLFDVYRIEGVKLFLDEIARGASMDQALMVSTGSKYADFESEFRVYLQGRFNLVGLLADTMYFWLFLAIITVIGFILWLLRRRTYYRKWEEEERLASTDFDYGDPDNPEDADDDEPWRR